MITIIHGLDVVIIELDLSNENDYHFYLYKGYMILIIVYM